MSQIYIIGTNHPYQILDDNSPSPHSSAYCDLLRQACTRYQIKGIAEEMSVEGLAGGSSLAQEVAQNLRIPYQACDPDGSERQQLGIVNEGRVKVIALLHEWSEDELSEAILAEYRKREEYWFHRVQDLDVWPLLFICGANHVYSFEKLLSNSGVDAEVLEREWSP